MKAAVTNAAPGWKVTVTLVRPVAAAVAPVASAENSPQDGE